MEKSKDLIKVSVVITTYNTEKYIKDCIESVLNNTYKNIEIILVDDGSTDNTIEICKKFQQKNNKIKLITQENSGVSSSRNRGLQAAFDGGGGVIHFMDGDDYVNREFYSKMVSAIQKDNLDMVCASIYNERLNLFDSPKPITHMGLLGKFSVNEGWMKGAWAFMFRTEFLLNNSDLRFDTTLFFGEDILFIVKSLFYAKKVSCAPDAIYYWRFNTKSVSNSNKNEEQNKLIREQQLLVGELLDKFAQEKNIPSEIWETHKMRNFRRQEKEWVNNFNIESTKEEITKRKLNFCTKWLIKFCCLFIFRSNDRKKFRENFLNLLK